MTDDPYDPRGLYRARPPRGDSFSALRFGDPSWIEPGASSRMIERPHVRPFRATRIFAEIRIGEPSLDHFRRVRRAGGSRRRGRLASQAWAITCLRIHQHPERFRPLVLLESLIIARREQILSPLPLEFFETGAHGAKTEIVLSTCPAGQDICVTVANHDVRPARVAVILVGRDP